ncbi:hypothetical protein C2S52_008352 [Perilla frutescens var. hirtella]|nr:hypothetical protein C2S52_008352 [Perilla frutescens var. hirtella]
MKKMVYIPKWSLLKEENNFGVKLGVSLVSFLLLAFTLVHRRSSSFSPLSHAPLLQINSASPGESINNGETCDFFVGDWVAYEGEPPYNSSCSFIIDPQNCIKNGRPDTDFLHWTWKPRGCDLPRLDPLKFLQMMRNKSWAFVGDSISRNHVQSFLCMLSTVEEPIQVYHDEDYKSQRWLFPSYNLTASVIWSPFLAKSIIPQNIYSASPSEIDLHLDTLDPSWTDHYNSWDYIVFSTGKWFSRSAIYYDDNNTILGCHSCSKRNLTELRFDSAYRRVIKRVLDYIITSNHRGSIFYRTNSPDHFEGKEWYNGGTCSRKKPVQEGEFELSLLDKILREIEMEEFAKAEDRANENGVKLRLFDVTMMSLLRPDGHPGVYRFNQPFVRERNGEVVSDCLHWCLPGPIDSWNHVLMEMILND